MKHLLIGITLSATALCSASFAAENPVESAPAGKAYVYKTSNGEKRQMEIFFPPNHNPEKSKVPGIIFFHGGTSAGGHISALATMNPGLNDPSDPKNIDTSVAAYIWVNPAFSGGDSRTPAVDLMRYLKADMPPSIVFFGENDGWKQGWDIAYAKWKSLGTKTIDLQIAPGEDHGFWNHSTQWQTVMLIATDNFLVKHGFLTGKSPLRMPKSGDKFIPATDK